MIAMFISHILVVAGFLVALPSQVIQRTFSLRLCYAFGIQGRLR